MKRGKKKPAVASSTENNKSSEQCEKRGNKTALPMHYCPNDIGKFAPSSGAGRAAIENMQDEMYNTGP